MPPVVGTPRPFDTRNNIPTETIDMFTFEKAPNGTRDNYYDNDGMRAWPNNASIYQHDADGMPPQHRRLKTQVCTPFATLKHNHYKATWPYVSITCGRSTIGIAVSNSSACEFDTNGHTRPLFLRIRKKSFNCV